MGNRCADHVTPLYPQKFALTSPTGGGRSVGIVRSRTKATEFSLFYYTFLTALQFGRSRVRFPIVSLEFFINLILLAHCGPGVDSNSHSNDEQKYFLWDECLCVGLTTSPPSLACFLEIWEPQTPGTLRVCSGLNRDYFNLLLFPVSIWMNKANKFVSFCLPFVLTSFFLLGVFFNVTHFHICTGIKSTYFYLSHVCYIPRRPHLSSSCGDIFIKKEKVEWSIF